ncbi:MAG: FAD-dependent oxidoreductase [Candidatus Methylomirabilia bacterium]
MTDGRRVEADVAVVGGGGAGLAAALEAARAGRRVALLEKNPYLGGTTRLSVGSISACGTPHQRRRGIRDSPQEFVEDMGLFNQDRGLASRDNPVLCRLLAEKSSETVEWLMGMGVEFFGPMPEPPNRYPRMHNVLPNSSAYIYHLARHARKHGVEILLESTAERLLTQDGRVAGVEGRSADGSTLQVVASRGVILATGDYSSSREMKNTYMSPETAEIEGINPTSTGDGHRIALDVGAQVVNGDLCLGPEIRFVAPPRRMLISLLPPLTALAKLMNLVATRLPAPLLRPMILAFLTAHLAPSPKLFEEGAILVNKEGRRFVNELERPALAIPQQPDQLAFIVFDDRLARRFSEWPYFISTAPGVAYAFLADYRRNRRDIYAQAASLDGVAQALKVPPASLAATVADYNRSVDHGADQGFGRTALGQGLKVSPYHALGPAKSWVVLTDGGLAVTARMEVLDRRGEVIPGLYAAGSTGQGGVLLEAHGLHLNWAFTSGRIAGRQAASD